MHHLLLVHVVECHQYLFDDVSSVSLGKRPPVFNDAIVYFHQVAERHEFHHYIEIASIGEEFEHMNDMGVIEEL